MKTKTRVALYGRNLVVSAIGACLDQLSGFDLIRIEEPLSDDLNGMGASRPDVILFDLASTQASFGVSLLHRYPEILLIGVDLRQHTMLVLSAASSRLSTIEDLVEGIEKRRFREAFDR